MSIYIVKYFEGLRNGHVFNKTDSRPLCNKIIKNRVVGKSEPFTVDKLRIELAYYQNEGTDICGVCAGKLYSDLE